MLTLGKSFHSRLRYASNRLSLDRLFDMLNIKSKVKHFWVSKASCYSASLGEAEIPTEKTKKLRGYCVLFGSGQANSLGLLTSSYTYPFQNRYAAFLDATVGVVSKIPIYSKNAMDNSCLISRWII